MPPRGARHLAALFFTEHLVLPVAVVRQQVTYPGGRPQVDLVAQRFTAEEHARCKVPALTA